MGAGGRGLVAALGCLVVAFACGQAPGEEPRPDANGEARAEASQPPAATPGEVQQLRFETLRVLPHDRRYFTQGLLWQEGLLYESIGQLGESALIAWDPETGEEVERVDLPDELFGEGLARVGDDLVQLTWRNGVALRWSLPPFLKVGEHTYEGEGWGLATDPDSGRLYMSDGSDVLEIRDPETFEVLDSLPVRRPDGTPMRYLNELEFADGSLYANLWTTETILRIDPVTGLVTAEIDASGLLDTVPVEGVDVMNGVAYHPDTRTFWITGKHWPLIFEGVFVE